MSNTESSKLTIATLYGQKVRAGDVGLEIEVEGEELPAEIGGAWLVKNEGSLRNGYEYYTRQPLKVDDTLSTHICKLTDNLKGKKVDMSNRTSVHVHVNVQQMTPVQVWTAVICYWMLEGPLTRLCGEKNRVGNLFCLGVEHAEGILGLCIKDLRKKTPFSAFGLEVAKYGGQNLSAVQRFGSLEYRSMRGTVDPVVIERWCRALYHIVEASKTFANPAKAVDFYLDSEKDQLLNVLLPADIRKDVESKNGYKDMIRNNILAIAEVAYFPKSWEKWGEDIENTFKVKKDKNDPDAAFAAAVRDQFEEIINPAPLRRVRLRDPAIAILED